MQDEFQPRNSFCIHLSLMMALFTTALFLSSPSQGAIESRTDDFTVRLGVMIPTLEISTVPKELPGKELQIKPNAPNKTFISLAHDWYGISVSAVNPVNSEREIELGETKALDYQFRFYFQKVAAEIFYQKYKGYYIENTGDVDPSWSPGQPRRLYPDLSTEHRGISLTYVFNPQNYSMAAAFDQSVRQTSSGGSWLANISISQHSFANPDPLIPTELAGTYGEFEKVTAGNLTNTTIGAGGAYTLVIADSYFLSALGLLNLGTQVLKYEKTNGLSSETSATSQAHLKLSLGYNGPRFISGFSLASDRSAYSIENTELHFQTLELGLFLGTRF